MNAAALDAAALIDGVAHGDVRASMRVKPEPDAAAMPSADADLFALVGRRRRYARRHRLADEEASAAYARYEAPPAPAALMITSDDHALTMVLATAEVGDVIDADVLERVCQFLALLDAAALVGGFGKPIEPKRRIGRLDSHRTGRSIAALPSQIALDGDKSSYKNYATFGRRRRAR